MIHFYKNRYKVILISVFIMLVGIACIFIRGIKLDISFVGGSISRYTYSGTMDIDRAETVVKAALENREVNAQLTHSETVGDVLVLNISGRESLTNAQQASITSALQKEFPDGKIALSESKNVQPFIGAKFARDSILAIVIASILIVLYVWFRFRKISSLSLGVFGLVALLHDCLIVFFTFVIFGIPLNDSFVAVVLTILGYSINDTVVIYDRIRENSRIMKPGTPLDELVDVSINQTMTRTINTFICGFLSVLAVLIFSIIYDISSITYFTLPMMMGMISGCYSTIFIASPFWVQWQLSKKKRLETKKA